jgi:hypothetical protein
VRVCVCGADGPFCDGELLLLAEEKGHPDHSGAACADWQLWGWQYAAQLWGWQYAAQLWGWQYAAQL